MEKVWAITPRFAANGFPFTTKNFNGQEIEVSSPSHLKALCAEFKVVHRDDAAWIDKRYEGYDFKTGKQRYTEGSGRGNPGQWV